MGYTDRLRREVIAQVFLLSGWREGGDEINSFLPFLFCNSLLAASLRGCFNSSRRGEEREERMEKENG